MINIFESILDTTTSAIPIGVFRAIFGILLLVNIFEIFAGRVKWFGMSGVIPDSLYRKKTIRQYGVFDIISSSYLNLNIVFTLYFFFTFLLIVGIYAQLSALICFLICSSLHSRNQLIFYGADSIHIVILFLLIFCPSDQVLSVRAMIYFSELVPNNQLTIPAWTVQMMKFQVITIYIYGFIWKLKGKSWRDGSAILSIASISYFRNQSLITSKVLINHTRTFTWLVMITEFCIALFLSISPLQKIGIALAIMLHLFIDAHLNLHYLGVTMLCCQLLFIPPETYNFLLH